MSEFVSNVQERFKSTASVWFLLLLRLMTGFMVGLTLALAGQVIFQYGEISFIMIILACVALSLKLMSQMNLVQILVTDLILVLVGLLLKLYIHMGPNL